MDASIPRRTTLLQIGTAVFGILIAGCTQLRYPDYVEAEQLAKDRVNDRLDDRVGEDVTTEGYLTEVPEDNSVNEYVYRNTEEEPKEFLRLHPDEAAEDQFIYVCNDHAKYDLTPGTKSRVFGSITEFVHPRHEELDPIYALWHRRNEIM